MRGQLQVRQGHVRDRTWDGHDTPDHDLAVTWAEWLDVRTGDWLIGYLLPAPGFVYEFRYHNPPD